MLGTRLRESSWLCHIEGGERGVGYSCNKKSYIRGGIRLRVCDDNDDDDDDDDHDETAFFFCACFWCLTEGYHNDRELSCALEAGAGGKERKVKIFLARD